jgi:hypothetical protein
VRVVARGTDRSRANQVFRRIQPFFGRMVESAAYWVGPRAEPAKPSAHRTRPHAGVTIVPGSVVDLGLPLEAGTAVGVGTRLYAPSYQPCVTNSSRASANRCWQAQRSKANHRLASRLHLRYSHVTPHTHCSASGGSITCRVRLIHATVAARVPTISEPHVRVGSVYVVSGSSAHMHMTRGTTATSR